MKDFKNKVAVITGAASGIGAGLAQYAASKGMKLVLADIEQASLESTAQKLREQGASVLTHVTDVSNVSNVERLAELAFSTHGQVHLLFNNAGVAAGSTIWNTSLEDWRWVLGVNLWGTLHGIQAFLPRMLNNETGHIVNTASAAGVLPFHPSASYQVSKHAVVALTENLHHTLIIGGSNVRTSVLCPGAVKTRILEAERNHPDPTRREKSVEADPFAEMIRHSIETGLSPAAVAEQTFEGIREERLHIFTHPEYLAEVRRWTDFMSSEVSSTKSLERA